MKKLTWTHSVAAALVTAVLGGQAQAQSATLNADADTSIRELNAPSNYGRERFVRVAPGLNRERTLVRFDQPKLVAAVNSRPVLKATLELTVQDVAWIYGALNVHRVSKAWTETGATWSCANDTAPTNNVNNCTSGNAWAQTAGQGYASAVSASQSINKSAVKFDVTNDVKAFLNGGQTNNGWLIKAAIEGPPANIRFKSREAGVAPRLVLELGGTAGPGPVGAPCEDDSDCAGYANAVCFSEAEFAIPGGYCSAPCSTNSECPSGSACISQACALPCSSTGTCSPGYFCNNTGSFQACLPTCTSDADCSDGRQCAPIINECRPPETPE